MSQPINTGMSDFSLHRYWTAVSCPQKYAYLYVLNLKEPNRGPALPFGTAVHFLLANHYAGRPEMEGVETLEPDVVRYMVEAKELVDEYKWFYRNESFDVISVETQIIVSVGDYKLSRRLDLTIAREGKLYVLDHKTAGDVQARIRGARTDPSLYSQEIVCEASGFAQQQGLDYGGFVLNVIGKQPGSNGLREFKREKIIWHQSWKDQFVNMAEYALSLPDRFSRLDPWRWPRTGDCVGKYGVCKFRDLCMYGESVLGKYL